MGCRTVGTFIHFHLIEGMRNDVFGRNGTDLAVGLVGFDVYDEDGNLLNDRGPLPVPPSDTTVFLLARHARAMPTAFIEPTADGWRFVAAGSKVNLPCPLTGAGVETPV